MNACKLINRLAEEDKSLITGDNEIFNCCRGRWILDRCWGFQKIFDYWRREIPADWLRIKDLWLLRMRNPGVTAGDWISSVTGGDLTRALTTSAGNENPSWLSWEIRRTLKTSTGELEPGRLLLEKWDRESSICWEINLWGECLLGWGNQELGCMPIYWGIILVGDKPRS